MLTLESNRFGGDVVDSALQCRCQYRWMHSRHDWASSPSARSRLAVPVGTVLLFGRLGLRENSAECFARELWLFGLMAVPAGSSLCRDAREVGGLQFGLFSEGCMRRANSPLSVRAWTEALAPWNTASHVQQGFRC